MAFLGIYGCLLEMDNGLRTTYFIALLHTHDHHAPNPLSASFLALAFSAGRFGVGIFFAYLSTVVIRCFIYLFPSFRPPHLTNTDLYFYNAAIHHHHLPSFLFYFYLK